MSVCASAMLATTLVSCVGQASTQDTVAGATEEPNILMVLLDDLGYTDLGVYGGEAETPTMDALAEDGVQFSNFHAYPLCAPTRAALMTGQDPHRVGLGSMEGVSAPGVPTTTPGYSGSLEGDYTGIAEVLSDAGYETYQVGKWHLGYEPEQSPRSLGFQQNFTLLDAASSYYPDATNYTPRQEEPVDTVRYERNGQPVESLPDDFYSTHAYTDEMLRMIDEGQDSGKPFFGYLAYNAPHDPLHIQDQELIDHYLDLYLNDNNYEELREQRISNLAEKGLIDADVATRWPSQTPEWEELSPEQQYDLAYRLAVYAAIIHDVDDQVGRVVDHLKETGEYDNTLIVLASDNGAASASRAIYAPTPEAVEWQNEHYPLVGDVASYGEPGSFPSLGLPNAQVSSGPFFHTKTTVFEGGTRVPAIIKTPGAGSGTDGTVADTFAHIGDLYPTFADYAGVELAGQDTLLGDSARPLLDGAGEDIGSDEFGMEMFGNRAYWSGDWKLVFSAEPSGGTGDYALYNLADDPGETTDVSAENPEILADLIGKWDAYATANGVVPADFEAVIERAPMMATRSYSIDWAENVQLPTQSDDE